MKKIKFLSLLLAAATVFGSFSLVACDRENTMGIPNEDNTVNENPIETDSGKSNTTIPLTYDPPTDSFIVAQSNLATNMFKQSVSLREDNKNILISPLSVALALAMTANGASNDTLKEFEELFGLSIEEINAGFKAYVNNLPSSEDSKLHIANSIWFRENGISLYDDFIKKNKENFSAEILQRAFDKSTVDEINAWVDENTDGMIDNLIDDIDISVMMYLINALVFDAKWEDQYSDYQVYEDEFTSFDGNIKKVNMMSSQEDLYINDGNAQGFIKRYRDGYSFVALLPNEGISVYDYIAGLDSRQLYGLISDPQYRPVNAELPQFKYEYSLDMADILKAMGLDRTFVGQEADFSKMGVVASNERLAVSRVLHKTVIELTQAGTKAAAVTAVEIVRESAVIPIIEPINVVLDRPFVYMIIDNNTNLPIFTGVVTDIEN